MAKDPEPEAPRRCGPGVPGSCCAAPGPCALAKARRAAPGRRPPGRAAGSRRAPRLAGAGIARWASPAGEAERKWRPPRCTNRVRPAGECHPAPAAGRRARGGHSSPRRVPGTPRARGAHTPGLGRRSVPGGSPPPPRPLRSRGGSGPARQAGPGAPAGTQRRPWLGRAREDDPGAPSPPGTRLPGARRAGTSAVTKPPGQAGRWPAGRRTPRPCRAAAAQPPGARARRPGPCAQPARPERPLAPDARDPPRSPAGGRAPGRPPGAPASFLSPLRGHGQLGTAGACAERRAAAGHREGPGSLLRIRRRQCQ